MITMRTIKAIRDLLPVALFLLPFTAEAGAQSRRFDLKVIPTVGWYDPTQDLRPSPEAGSSEWTRMTAGPTIGLHAELGLPLPVVGLRAGLMYAASDLAVRRFAGWERCGESCRRATYDADPITGSRILIAVGDLVLRGPHFRAVQPYLLAGGGIRHYDFGQEELVGEFATAYADDETQRIGHLGLGIDLGVGRYRFILEANDYIGEFAPGRTDASAPRYARGGKKQNDVAITAGFRINHGAVVASKP
jgi:hypothetical protein